MTHKMVRMQAAGKPYVAESTLPIPDQLAKEQRDWQEQLSRDFGDREEVLQLRREYWSNHGLIPPAAADDTGQPPT